MAVFDRLKALVVRFFLALHFALVVWRVTVSWESHYWLMGCAILPFLVEGVYTIVRRAGLEWRLFSLCFFFYLCATLPGIWLLEIKKTLTYQQSNTSQVEDIVVSGVEIPIRLSPNTWVLVTEEMMLYLMILGRWLLPRGGVGREQLTQLLFGFVGIASDIMELFSLFDEASSVRHDPLMTYCILGVWSLSIFQFTLTFATSHRPRRSRGLRLSNADPLRKQRVSVLRVELLATVLSMLMQDGPFLVLRLYTIVTFNVITYSLVFFTAKNVLVLLLLTYKTFLLLGKLCCPKSHEDKDDEEEEEEDEMSKDDEFLGPFANGMGVVEKAPIYHINGRVMHPASRMPQFVNMRNRRTDDGVKLNPLYAGHDKYGIQYIGDHHRNYVSRNVVDPQRNHVSRNLVDPRRDYISQNLADQKRNQAIRNLADPQRNRGIRNVGDIERDSGVQIIGDLQRAIEGPATPAKKVVRGVKKFSNRVKEDGNDVPTDTTTTGTHEAPPQSDPATINSDAPTGQEDSDIQTQLNGGQVEDPHTITPARNQEFSNASDDNAEDNSAASVAELRRLDVLLASLGDTTVLADNGEEVDAAGGRIPTNGAVNALVLATADWEEGREEEAQTTSDTGQRQTTQVRSGDASEQGRSVHRWFISSCDHSPKSLVNADN